MDSVKKLHTGLSKRKYRDMLKSGADLGQIDAILREMNPDVNQKEKDPDDLF